ncbi:hypothetical protein D3C71_1536980 [compost metagenome]
MLRIDTGHGLLCPFEARIDHKRLVLVGSADLSGNPRLNLLVFLRIDLLIRRIRARSLQAVGVHLGLGVLGRNREANCLTSLPNSVQTAPCIP